MNDLDDHELQVLQAARRALSPTAEDAARVLAATELAIAALPAGSPNGTPAAASSGASTFAQSLGAKLMAALTIGAVSGAIGYYAGYQHARRDAVAESVPPSAAAPRSPAPVSAVATTPATEKLAAAEPVAADPQNLAPDTAAPGARAAATVAERIRGRSTPRVQADAGVTALGPQSLQAELDALRRVERALRDHEPKRALVLLAELDRSVPDGKLDEERLAAFVMARCAVKLGTPGGLVAEFTGKYPHSAYLARVQSSCKANQ